MNFIKPSLSLAGAFALAVSANAQSLEEAIRGVEMRLHLTPVRMAKIKNSGSSRCQ